VRANLPGPVDRLLRYVRTKLWSQMQQPDIDTLHRRGGVFLVSAYLQQCWSPDLTKEILARYGADIHLNAWPVGPNVTIHEARGSYENLSIGAFSHVGKQVFLDLTDRIIIEGSVSVGMRAMILTHLNVGEYPDKPIAKLIPKRQKPTILRRGCSVGAGCVVLCGVEIGEDAVINAGVVVDRDVPPGTVVTSSRQKPDYQMPQKLLRKARAAMERRPADTDMGTGMNTGWCDPARRSH
jgi:acetyltransferase-like isoleucine patch superfamily enzyme